MPDPTTLVGEIEKWKIACNDLSSSSQTITCMVLDALKLADREFFTNVHEIMLTLPVGSVP